MLKKGELVELIEDTLFYKKGSIAVIICEYDSQNRDSDKIEIRWEKNIKIMMLMLCPKTYLNQL